MRQSRKKWERKREEQRNKVIALLFIVMMVAAPALTTGAFVPIEWSVRTFMPTFDMSFFMGLSISMNLMYRISLREEISG